MAFILYPDGNKEEIQPENGRDFQLPQLRKIVGGRIQLIPTKDGRLMVLNDDGKLLDFPRNEQATQLLRFPSAEEVAALAALPGVMIIGNPAEDYIVGTVLVCKPHEVK
jgi:hypothetical protein